MTTRVIAIFIVCALTTLVGYCMAAFSKSQYKPTQTISLLLFLYGFIGMIITLGVTLDPAWRTR